MPCLRLSSAIGSVNTQAQAERLRDVLDSRFAARGSAAGAGLAATPARQRTRARRLPRKFRSVKHWVVGGRMAGRRWLGDPAD